LDDEGNIQFEGKYLKQIFQKNIEEQSDLVKILEKLVERSEKKKKKKI